MKKISSRVLLIALLATAGVSTAQSNPEEERVLAAEDEYISAEVGRDEPVLRRLVDDRFVLNASNGKTAGKEQLIQSILQLNMVGQTLRERTVLVEGDIAFVFGTADLRFALANGTQRKSSLRYTTTYIKRGGQWRMLTLQMQQRAPN